MKKFGKKRKLEKMTVNAYACQCNCICSCNCSCSCSCSCSPFVGAGVSTAQRSGSSAAQYVSYRNAVAGGVGGGMSAGIASTNH
jgi:putative bacteriocin precursor